MGSLQPALRLRSDATGTDRGGAVTPARTRRGRLIRWLLMAASIAIVVYVAWRAWPEVRDAAQVVQQIAPGVLLLALVFEAAAVACLAQVYRASLASLGFHLGYRQGLQVSMGAFTLSRVLPGGGAAGGVWATRRLQTMGVPWAIAGTGVLLEGVLAMATLGFIVAGGTVAALLRGHVSGRSVVAACLVAGTFAGIGWAAYVLLRSASARASLFGAARRVVPRAETRLLSWRNALDELAQTVPSGRGLLPVLGWSAVNWLLDITALWIVFAGLGLHMEIGVLIVGFGVANLVTALPHTPGGLGLVEAGMTGTYVALGTDTAAALAAVLAYRLIAFWLPVLVGVPQYLRTPSRPKGAPA